MKAFTTIGLVLCALVPWITGCQEDQKGHSGMTPSASQSAAASFQAPPVGSLSSAAPAQTALIALTPEQEKDAHNALVLDCMACHTEEMIAQQRLTPKQWGNVIKKMQGWGSKLETASVDVLVSYLSTRYGLSAKPFEPTIVDAKVAAEALTQLPDGPFAKGDVKAGETLYKADCAACHGNNARGTDKGINIADRPILWRAADFAAINRAGKGRMPSFPKHKDEDIANLLAYLRTIRAP